MSDFIEIVTDAILQLEHKPEKIIIDSSFIFPASEIVCSNLNDFKEGPTMQVSYNGFTGELVKLEKTFCNPKTYDISIYDSEKQVTHSFTGVKLEDVKFLGGEVSFGG